MIGHMQVPKAVSAPQSAPRRCDEALTKAFNLLGKRWNGELIGVLTQGPAGFAELTRALAGISQSMLADRLTELVRAGLVTRTVQEGPPLRVSYRLSPPGEALVPVLGALMRWAAEYLAEEVGCEVTPEHS